MHLTKEEQRALRQIVKDHISEGINNFKDVGTGHQLRIYAEKEGLSHWILILDLQNKLYSPYKEDE